MKTYTPVAGESINEAAFDMVSLCQESGGEEVIARFNDIEIKAHLNTTREEIVQYYMAESKRRSDAYLSSPEHAASQRKAQQAARRQQLLLEGALSMSPEKMTVGNQEAFDKTVKANKDGYGKTIIDYAQRWARLIEGKINHGSTLEECAEEASHLADNDGITGFMYGAAVSVLASCWVHGEQLRRWHNLSSQIGTEGEKANENGGVLNPAIMVLG